MNNYYHYTSITEIYFGILLHTNRERHTFHSMWKASFKILIKSLEWYDIWMRVHCKIEQQLIKLPFMIIIKCIMISLLIHKTYLSGTVASPHNASSLILFRALYSNLGIFKYHCIWPEWDYKFNLNHYNCYMKI